MDISKLSNDGLLFHYFNNKRQIELLYKQQKELEEEISTRLEHMRYKAGRGEFIVTDEG